MDKLEMMGAVTIEENTGESKSVIEKQNADKSDDKSDNKSLEKKYTDEDLDRIIAKKIAAERKRMSKIFNEEQQENEYDERFKKLEMREMKMDAIDKLNEKNFPRQLADLMNYSSIETYEESFEKVINLFSESLSIAIKDLNKGTAPKINKSFDSRKNDYRDAFKHPSSR